MTATAPERVRSVASAGDALFRPVRAGNAFEETVERLLTAIKLGVVAPGGQLPPERELSERLSVSRVTLREAIRDLQQNGYLESRRGRYGGTFVQATLPRLRQPAAPRRLAKEAVSDLEDTLLLREVLEVGAADRAAARPPAEAEADHLTACRDDCGRAGGLAEYRRLDSRFHLAVAEVTGSPSLTTAIAGVRMRANAFLDAILVLPRHVDHSELQHDEILGAILAGDRGGARAAMAEHVSATAALLRGFLGHGR
ncbi:MAG TPA: FCD domain-containing protein [Acidimicrobiales bacterium]